jgi:excisionase family DNA binding protein
MSGESYTLREVAELLGVSKRTLQRRIKDGAFPRRFLSPGRHGLETRIPVEDVQQALNDLKHQTRYPRFALSQKPVAASSPGPAKSYAASPSEFETRVSMSVTDLESFRDSMIETIRDEREVFLQTLRDALVSRDQELDALRGQVGQLEQVILLLQDKLQGSSNAPVLLDAAPKDQTLLPASTDTEDPVAEDAQSILQEIEQLEALLGLWSQTPN